MTEIPKVTEFDPNRGWEVCLSTARDWEQEALRDKSHPKGEVQKGVARMGAALG